MVFISLEKVSNRMSREVMLWALEKNHMCSLCINTIKDMYEEVLTNLTRWKRDQSIIDNLL